MTEKQKIYHIYIMTRVNPKQPTPLRKLAQLSKQKTQLNLNKDKIYKIL